MWEGRINEIDLKELFKVAVEILREQTIRSLLNADMTYQKDSENEGIAERDYLQLDLTTEQREVCNRLLECRDKEDCEYMLRTLILQDSTMLFGLWQCCFQISGIQITYGSCLLQRLITEYGELLHSRLV